MLKVVLFRWASSSCPGASATKVRYAMGFPRQNPIPIHIPEDLPPTKHQTSPENHSIINRPKAGPTSRPHTPRHTRSRRSLNRAEPPTSRRFNSPESPTNQPQWSPRSSSGAASVNPPIPPSGRPGPIPGSNTAPQASSPAGGRWASRCAPSSTRSPSGCTPSTWPAAAPSDTGCRASRSGSRRT